MTRMDKYGPNLSTLRVGENIRIRKCMDIQLGLADLATLSELDEFVSLSGLVKFFKSVHLKHKDTQEYQIMDILPFELMVAIYYINSNGDRRHILIPMEFITNDEIDKRENVNKVINPDGKDTTGRLICEGDTILLFNANQDNKKWSKEVVIKDDGKLYLLYKKFMRDIYTDITKISPNYLMVTRTAADESLVFTDN